MMALDSISMSVLFLLLAFGPSLFYLRWVRNLERFGREPLGKVLRAFAWGALGSIIWVTIFYMLTLGAADAVYGYIEESFAGEVDLGGEVLGLVLLAVILAPLLEEFTKMWGVSSRARVRDQFTEVEDAMIYGAAIGLGFATTENLLYGLTALNEEGTGAALVTLGMRAISSTLLHTSATAIAGYGVGRVIVLGEPRTVQLRYYLLAVGLHATFNGFAVVGEVLELSIIPFIIILGLAWTAFSFVRDRITDLDTHRMESRRDQRPYGRQDGSRPTTGVGPAGGHSTSKPPTSHRPVATSYGGGASRSTYSKPPSHPHGSDSSARATVRFPVILDCPRCTTKLKVGSPGKFRCARCKTVSRVTSTGQVSTGQTPPAPRRVAKSKTDPKGQRKASKPARTGAPAPASTMDLKVMGPRGRGSRVTVPRSLTVAQLIEATRSHFGLAPLRYVMLRADQPLNPSSSLASAGLSSMDQLQLIESD